MRLRSALYVPADNARFVGGAADRGADAVILDLEDAVLPANKARARDALSQAVPTVAAQGAKVIVRINAGDHMDAQAAARAGADLLLVPKLRDAAELMPLVALLEGIETETGRPPMRLIGAIEDPGAVLDARRIASGPRLIGLLTGSEDLATAMGAVPDPEVLRLPKLLVHYAAKAAGLRSLGLLRSVADYADAAALAAAVDEARRFGFDGATCIHPSAVSTLNKGFSPSEAEVDWARRVLAAADTAGAFTLDGRMVDAPVIERARRTLDRAGEG